MQTHTPPDRVLRIKAVLARTGLSRATLYRKMQDGTFPPNFKISERCAGWLESAVDTWLHDRVYYNVRDHNPR